MTSPTLKIIQSEIKLLNVALPVKSSIMFEYSKRRKI